MPEPEEFSIDDAKTRLGLMNKRLGARRPDLKEHAGTSLCYLLGITEQDSMGAAQDKATFELNRLIEERLDPEISEMARGYFNTSSNPLLWNQDCEDRLDKLGAQLEKPISGRTIARRSKTFVPLLQAGLDKLGAGRASGRWAPAGHPIHGEWLHNDMQYMNDPQKPAKQVIHRFLDTTFHGPSCPRNGFLLAAPENMGPWLCTFTNLRKYTAYLLSAGAPWNSSPFGMTGSALLRDLDRRGLRVGILVDPNDGGVAQRKEIGWFPPELVHAITRTL